MVDNDWLVVVKTNPRDLFKIPDNDDNCVEIEDEELLNEEVYQQEEAEFTTSCTNDQENIIEVSLHRLNVQEEREQIAAELHRNMELEFQRKMEIELERKLAKESELANVEVDKRIYLEVDKRMHEQFASFMTRMQQGQGT